ncbi:cell wall hydrolase [Marivibrio halodurans]|uniref:Cell wall hydrolase n=1 Tax=Marivibrio halodurans TaxID=2039722 RepID=A0A8J7V1X4_9PROT|nr:cell wall hydrolase [Marivibrio halodurans]MBP5856272.1 cell wall hydrolase [Marivibrio halodurans]
MTTFYEQAHPMRESACPAADDGPVIDLLARTVWGEARGEPVRGREAVAACVMNRVALATARGGHWWGTNVVAVCRAPWQFACWNEGDPNREQLLAVDRADPVFQSCLRIARRAVRGALIDPTGGATHYHHEDMLPWWAKGRAPTCRIGRHVFYRDIG